MSSSTSPSDAVRSRAALLAAAYLCVVLIGIWHHELWRDEWQAWMLARDSGSFLDLIHSLSHEGHFPAWYGLLFVLGRFTRDPLAMQMAHAVIATGSIYLLGRYAPFPWALKILVAFGYFLAYEYAVLARPYALGMLGLFLFCAFYEQRRRSSWGMALGLGLLVASSIYGLILATAAVGMLLLDVAARPASSFETRDRQVRARRGLVAWGTVLVAVVVVLLIFPLNFLSGAPGTNPLPLLSRWGLAATMGTLGEAYLPLPELFTAHPRETHVLGADSTLELALLLGLSLLLVAASVLMLVRRPLALFLYLVGTTGLLLFSHVVFRGFIRHHGHLFLLFLTCLWLAWERAEWRPPPPLDRWTGTGTPWARAVVTGILLVHVAAAGVLYVADLRRPFSVAGEVAGYLRAEGLDRLPILASPSPPASSVAGFLDRPIHYLGTGTTGTFVPWHRFARGRDQNFSMMHLREFVDARGPEVLVILGAPHHEWDEDLQVEELARFEAGIERTEKYVIYRVEEGT